MKSKMRKRRTVRAAARRVRRRTVTKPKRDARETPVLVGGAHDPAEKAADRAAAQVMAGQKVTSMAPAAAAVHRACADCEEDKKDQDNKTAKRSTKGAPSIAPGAKAGRAGAKASAAIHAMGPGKPLARADRAFFEPRFGRDLSAVRVHDGPPADRAARSIDARAFAWGSDIAFAAGERERGGARLLGHELAHVAAGGATARRMVHRDFKGCANLMQSMDVTAGASLIKGQVVHDMIEEHFSRKVRDSVSIGIPGASSAPRRSQGICGKDDPVIRPQKGGGKAGIGYPDLSSLGSGGVLSVAEIKPAVPQCLVDGEEQALGYVNQGNGHDPAQARWRAANNISVVSPMLPSKYKPPSFTAGPLTIRTAWCTPGLMGYAVKKKGKQPPVPVRVPEHAVEKVARRVRMRVDGYHEAFARYVRDVRLPEAVPGRRFAIGLEAGLFAQQVAEAERLYLESKQRVMRVDPRNVPLFQVQPVLIGGAIVAAPIAAALLAALVAPAIPMLLAAIAKVAAAAATAAAAAGTAAGAAMAVARGPVIKFAGAAAAAVISYLMKGGMSEAEASEAVKPLMDKPLLTVVDVTGKPEWENAKPGQSINAHGSNFNAIMIASTPAEQ